MSSNTGEAPARSLGVDALAIFGAVLLGVVVYVFAEHFFSQRLWFPLAGHIAITNVVVITLAGLVSAITVTVAFVGIRRLIARGFSRHH